MDLELLVGELEGLKQKQQCLARWLFIYVACHVDLHLLSCIISITGVGQVVTPIYIIFDVFLFYTEEGSCNDLSIC